VRRILGLSVSVAFAVLLISPRAALASTIVFSNFGPLNSYYTNGFTGWTVSSTTSGAGSEVDTAMGFTPGATYTLDSVALAAGYISGLPNELDVSLQTDASGPSGVVLESWTFTNLASLSSGSQLLSAASVLNPTLSSGSLYWLVAEVPESGTTLSAWNFNSIGDLGPGAQNVDDGGWEGFPTTDRGAFEIDGTASSSAVPEPASLVLLGTGLLATVSRFRRRRSTPDTSQ
jgi:hypothetical protein